MELTELLELLHRVGADASARRRSGRGLGWRPAGPRQTRAVAPGRPPAAGRPRDACPSCTRRHQRPRRAARDVVSTVASEDHLLHGLGQGQTERHHDLGCRGDDLGSADLRRDSAQHAEDVLGVTPSPRALAICQAYDAGGASSAIRAAILTSANVRASSAVPGAAASRRPSILEHAHVAGRDARQRLVGVCSYNGHGGLLPELGTNGSPTDYRRDGSVAASTETGEIEAGSPPASRTRRRLSARAPARPGSMSAR